MFKTKRLSIVIGIGVGLKSASLFNCGAGLSAPHYCTIHLVSVDFKTGRMNMTLCF